MTAIIVLSMAASPLLMMLDDKIIQPWLGATDVDREADVIEHQGVDVIIAGHGRFGMTIGRVLNAQKIRSVILDHDASQVDVIRKFGMKAFYGDALRLDLLEAAGAKEAKILIVAIDEREKTNALVQIAQTHFPNLKIIARAYDRTHAIELLRKGVGHVHREVFASSLNVATDALIELGASQVSASRIAKLFRIHDEEFLRKSMALNGNQKALIDLARQARAEIANVFSADQNKTE